MKKANRIYLYSVTGIVILLMLPAMSHAYLDPGSGSYIIQIIIAGLVAGSFAIKLYWRKLKTFLKSLLGRDQSSSK
jgi:energy-coupling factor transporter transmembrane protein EcfT